MKSLVQTIRSLSLPLAPMATGMEPHLQMLPNIRAVIFDVYGTIFISGSGDISLAEEQDCEVAMRETLRQYGFALRDESIHVTTCFHATLSAAQETRRREGISYPEVEIREVWETLLSTLKNKGQLEGEVTPEIVAVLALAYECRVNPVWPMPGLKGTLTTLRRHNLLLGIVSNAQFFTPLLFEAFLEADLDSLGFVEGCCIWSYCLREAKPSMPLYEKLVEALADHSIQPEQTLYLGNDIRNDVWPAQAVGLKTALFAGDERSLRLREDDSRYARLKPDLVITELPQILRCI